jgi:excisionase family DNA binding protein
MKLFTTTELANLLGLAPQTIRNLLHTQPESLPCAYRIRGMRKVLFRADDVASFLESRQEAVKQDSRTN